MPIDAAAAKNSLPPPPLNLEPEVAGKGKAAAQAAPAGGNPEEGTKKVARNLALVASVENVRNLLAAQQSKIAEVLPKLLKIERLIRVVTAVVARTPELLACTAASFLSAVMTAAQLGLEPTGVLGSAYLVPFSVPIRGPDGKKTGKYRKEVVLIIGYRGLIDLARRSGQIESIEAHVVHANDKFTCRYGLDPVLEHEPLWTGEPGPVIAAYAVAKFKDGGKQIEVMTKRQLDKIKHATQGAGQQGPWFDHEDEQQRKTVVRRIAKYLPLTVELADALAHEDHAVLDGPTTGEPNGQALSGTDRLRAIRASDEAQDVTLGAEGSDGR